MTSNARELAQIPSTPSGRRNLIINGAMQVAQRSTSVTGIGASSGYFTVDRFKLGCSGTAGRLTMTQTADGPSGFANCIKLDCTTADTSIAADEFVGLQYRPEGQDLQRFMKGTSDAKEYTLSFYVKGNASATYAVELYDFDNTRQVSKLFSVTTDWTRVEITYPADTTGAFDDDNAASMMINIFLHAGSNFTSGTLNQTWASATNANRAVGISSFFDSTDRTFFITGMQLEVGSVATEFEHRSFGEELDLCMRYYQRVTRINNDNVYIGLAQAAGTTVGYVVKDWEKQLRANPTFGVSSATDAELFGSMGARQSTAVSMLVDGTQNGLIQITVSGGLTADNANRAYLRSHAAFYELDAEL
jgi:hypothetical protein